MRYIGRIITTTKIDDISEFIDVTKDTSTIINNEAKIPTLIIGYKNAKEICGDIKILEKKIGTNLYWTFSKRERRIDYEPDMKKFLSTVCDFVMKYCEYEYIDLITVNDEKKDEINDIFRDKTHKKVVYTTNSMHYIYVPNRNKIYGFSKEVLKFLGRDELTKESPGISGNNSFFFVDDTEFFENKISNSKFVEPLLYYLKTF